VHYSPSSCVRFSRLLLVLLSSSVIGMGAQQSNYVGRAFAARLSINHQQFSPTFRVESTTRSYQSQSAPLYPPVLVNGEVVVPIGIFRENVVFPLNRPKNEEFDGVVSEVLINELGPELASVALSLAADPNVLAAIANNDDFQKFRTKLEMETSSLSLESSSSPNTLPISHESESPSGDTDEDFVKEDISTKYLQTNLSLDDENAKEKMDKILSTSNALRMGTCLSSLDHSKLASQSTPAQAEDKLSSEVVQVVCGVCHHPLEDVKTLQPPVNHTGNGPVTQPPSVDGPLTTFGNAVRSQSELLSVVLPIVAAVLVASFLFRSTRCRNFMRRVFSQAISQLKNMFLSNDLKSLSGKLISPSD